MTTTETPLLVLLVFAYLPSWQRARRASADRQWTYAPGKQVHEVTCDAIVVSSGRMVRLRH